ncbi:hypothetical protein [Streptomyces sp. NPDC085540]|uniref:hypothetical protein n=1 Tax=Streptomyces sp. NPDC085540 TaxID=3365730 RepID=UPI0037D5734F
MGQAGTKRLSRRGPNGEPELLQLLQDVLTLGDHVTRAVDMAGGAPAPLLGPCSQVTTRTSSTSPARS